MPEVVARTLVRRGIDQPDDARAFLDIDLGAMPDPGLMADAERAATRLLDAVERGERITVYGDYDVDGVTSTAVLWLFFRDVFGHALDFYIPHRLKEGYGLNVEAIEALAEAGTRVLVTVDNGSSAVREITRATELGMDVVILDHHLVSDPEPPAFAHLNPHRSTCAYPDKRLAAVGVTFMMLVALRRLMRSRGAFEGRRPPRIDGYLDLVALGTVADVAPLQGVNRALVRHGLRIMRGETRLGLRALMEVSRVTPEQTRARDLGFRLGPRINAAGRLDDATRGLQLLIGDDPGVARTLAERVEAQNTERRDIERRIADEASARVEAMGDLPAAIVLADGRWHPGVIGIVASRLVERFDRPTILLGSDTRDADAPTLKGSGRSVPGFDLKAGLDACGDHLERWGGHVAAAGLALQRERVEAFVEAFVAHAGAQIEPGVGGRPLRVDAEVDLTAFRDGDAYALDRLGPFGEQNPAPLLLARNVPVRRWRTIGTGHLKLELPTAEGTRDGLAWRMADREPSLGGPLDIVFSPEIEVFRGRERVVHTIRDLRPAGEGSAT